MALTMRGPRLKAIEQAGFAGIRAPQRRATFTEYPTLGGCGQQFLDTGTNLPDVSEELLAGVRINAFFGKIDARFQMSDDLRPAEIESSTSCQGDLDELFLRGSQGFRKDCRSNDIHYRFSLCQVHLAAEKRSSCKLAGFRRAPSSQTASRRAKLPVRRRDNEIPPCPLPEARRRPKDNCQTFIKLTFFVAKTAEMQLSFNQTVRGILSLEKALHDRRSEHRKRVSPQQRLAPEASRSRRWCRQQARESKGGMFKWLLLPQECVVPRAFVIQTTKLRNKAPVLVHRSYRNRIRPGSL